MKKTNCGFLMVETLVVGVFILTVLVILFLQFKNLVDNYNKSYNYNTVEGIYSLNAFKKYTSQNTIKLNSPYVLIGNSEGCEDLPNKEFCTALMTAGDFKTVLYTSSDVKEFKTYLKKTKDPNISEGLKTFISQINDKPNRQRLIAEFKNGTYATIVFI